jgi:hypothetical protein
MIEISHTIPKPSIRKKRPRTTSALATIPPLLLKESEAAQMLNISTRVLWTLNNKGLISCIWLGNSKRYTVAELERFVQCEQEKANECR